MISAVGARWPPGSVEFSDSDEEDERVGVGMSNRHDEGLTSFPVDSWEDTWDDSDAPVSQEVHCSLMADLAHDTYCIKQSKHVDHPETVATVCGMSVLY